jgi:putative hemolysin
MPDGTLADSWMFLQGSQGQQFSYCAQQGYRQQVVHSYRTCSRFGLDECLVCLLPDGGTREVTELMNLSFAETTCGDQSCGSFENVISCPADCRTGGRDDLCDMKRDGRCDPDCPGGAGDPDCGGQQEFVMIAAVLVIVLVAGAGIFLYSRRRRSP